MLLCSFQQQLMFGHSHVWMWSLMPPSSPLRKEESPSLPPTSLPIVGASGMIPDLCSAPRG